MNVSMSGVLFRAPQALQPQSAVEVALTLPVAIAGEVPAEIGCRGTIIRNVPVKGSDKLPLVAASILRYRFVHRRQNAGRDGSPS